MLSKPVTFKGAIDVMKVAGLSFSKHQGSKIKRYVLKKLKWHIIVIGGTAVLHPYFILVTFDVYDQFFYYLH